MFSPFTRIRSAAKAARHCEEARSAGGALSGSSFRKTMSDSNSPGKIGEVFPAVEQLMPEQARILSCLQSVDGTQHQAPFGVVDGGRVGYGGRRSRWRGGNKSSAGRLSRYRVRRLLSPFEENIASRTNAAQVRSILSEDCALIANRFHPILGRRSL